MPGSSITSRACWAQAEYVIFEERGQISIVRESDPASGESDLVQEVLRRSPSRC